MTLLQAAQLLRHLSSEELRIDDETARELKDLADAIPWNANATIEEAMEPFDNPEGVS